MSNQNPYLPTFRSSYTGESQNIGGSSPFHIDFRLLSSLPWQEKIRAIDSLANQYDINGRRIEFSNEGVAGRVWDVNATPEQKKALYEAATRSHANRPGWDPLDFYVPFKTAKDRFEKGAVEGASIYIPGVPGGRITRGSGGGYGYFSEAVDPSGRVVFRVGHGDINRPEEQTTIVVDGSQQATPTTPAVATGTKTADELLLEKLGEIMRPQPQVGNVYTGPSEESFQQTRDELDKVALQLMLEKNKQKEQPTLTYQPSVSGPAAAALAQKAFATPKSLI